MPQVYAAVTDGAGNYLIARKRNFNKWWARYAALVLAMEALTLVCKVNANPVPDWTNVHAHLSSAYRAASDVLRDGTPAFPDAANALDVARNACLTTHDGKLIADNVLFAVRNLIDVTTARRPAVALAPNIRTDTDTLASSIPASVGNPLQWNAPRAQAEAIARNIASWADSQRPTIVNQAGQWALPGGGIHDGESPEAAARREFAEETGFSLDDVSDFPCDPPVDLTDTHGELFHLMCFQTTRDLGSIVTSINQATAAGASGSRPRGSGICDWEIASMRCVNKSKLTDYLGIPQTLSAPALWEGACITAGIAYPPARGSAHLIRSSSGWEAYPRHAIDWYAQIALHLQAIV
ncbi:NUDIX domain-containing protein [Xanthomonas prunicola]|uniref:NUDIX domain-containing protein n=1 Tax=Xanthomonas prunicola TaxID=2053930 RepID=A0A9Q9IXF3_9XANT|nr:NUDIX domain-containing protein [Xanthomonas prunicola]UXA54053.1 NUDIX domain-containing protein [Xanthomonas prunicola]UXA56572.1 NUDIX domain-containing protein [Xanthomonas prunicola]UXA62531.1 NUDIX domain-containing protein [Xanthomonas prunicola]UXA64731.1 NUDIX domain-containing protein [Xanthomonas prunicola]UXA68321.1 NUDIX domain-containing protein [Xanthomonas prunicola]